MSNGAVDRCCARARTTSKASVCGPNGRQSRVGIQETGVTLAVLVNSEKGMQANVAEVIHA